MDGRQQRTVRQWDLGKRRGGRIYTSKGWASSTRVPQGMGGETMSIVQNPQYGENLPYTRGSL